MIRKIVPVLCVVLLCASVAQAAGSLAEPKNPVDFGLRDLTAAFNAVKQAPATRFYAGVPGQYKNAAFTAAAKVLPAEPESFAIARSGKDVAIVGRDQTGAMYGCLELAERLGMKGAGALDISKPIVQSPAVEFRAVNPFLTLPYKEDDESWYFLQEDYWKGYLDLLARSRINWVDLHGMYDIRTSLFPNIYPYFITSEKFPKVGVEPEAAKRNLAMLKKIMRMAKNRGIRFAMMSYSATWEGEGLRNSPYEASEENLTAYTREVVRKMIQECPDLEMIGFRIGESGKKESFYQNSYLPAIQESGRAVALYTRTWGAKKPAVLDIGKEFPGRLFIEIKYNGEQFGPPYILAGGRMQGWRDYSYQQYYSYPKNYKIIYQLRANGTHRVFPWGNPALAARANLGSLLAGSIGHCIEPIDAYYPKYDYRHRDDYPNKWFKWQYERDWFFYKVWGRTGYDPSLGERDDLWVRMFEKRFGKAVAKDLFEAMKWASMIVPDAYTSYALGPDHRQHASELEWGDHVRAWAKGKPFDVQNVQSPGEFAESLMSGNYCARATPLDMARWLRQEVDQTRRCVNLVRENAKNPSQELEDLLLDLTALGYLGDYYSHKLTAAAHYALMTASSDLSLEPTVRAELAAAKEGWDRLAMIGNGSFKPFVDRLRMHTQEYTWAVEGDKLSGDAKVLDETVAEIKASGKTGTAPAIPKGAGPPIKSVTFDVASTGVSEKTLTVTVKLDGPNVGAKVFLKTKPFPSDQGPWALSPMDYRDGVYTGVAKALPEGLTWCVEVVGKSGRGTMWPNFRRDMPYRIVEPWDAPMPSAL